MIGTRQDLTLQPNNRTLENLPLIDNLESIKLIEHENVLNVLSKNNFFEMKKHEDAYLFQVNWYPYLISEKFDYNIFLNSSSSYIGTGLSFLLYPLMTIYYH